MRESKIYAGVNLDTYTRPKPNLKYKDFHKPEISSPPAFDLKPNLPPATNSATLAKRGGKKLQTFILNKELASLKSPMQHYYHRAMNCCNEIRQDGKELVANYCNCRSCKVCCDIRQSKLQEKYHEILESFREKRFVTLTVKNITADVNELKWLQSDMFKHHRRVQDLLRKHGINIKGIRKYEPIPAKDLNGFHPHFHWIIDGEISEEKIFEIWATQKLCPDTLLKMINGFVFKTVKNETYNSREWVKVFGSFETLSEPEQKKVLANMKAEMLIQLWLKKYKGFADRKGQDSSEVTEGSEAELFKYTTKLLVKTKNNGDVVPLRLLDMVFNATKGVRTIQVTGYVTTRPRCPIHRSQFKFYERLNKLSILEFESGSPDGFYFKIDWRRAPRMFSEFSPIQKTLKPLAPASAAYSSIKKIVRYILQLESYLTYKIFTEAEEEDVTEDLSVQEYQDIQDCSTVYVWRGENWYCINTGQPLTTYKADARINKLLESFHYG